MGSPTGYVLRLAPEREDLLEQAEEDHFAEPVPEFQHSRNIPLVGFVVANSGYLTWVAKAKRGVRAGTGLRRLNLEDFHEVKEQVHVEDLIQHCESRFRLKLKERLTGGGLLPPKTFQELLNVLSQLAPRISTHLSLYSDARRKRIAKLPEKAREILAEQKEAVATAMSIAGIEREELRNWDLPEATAPASYLDGLAQVRLREDPMIINDSQVFPGFEAIKSTPFNSVVFESDWRTLTVLITNRQALENQLGVDLIYYNETFQAFLMVQYKAMEKEGEQHVFRLPDSGLTDEINRMKGVLAELRKCKRSGVVDSYRFCENPFFLKICPRLVFDPDNVGLVRGMYLPLDYWDLISESEHVRGSRGGRFISYSNVRRYLDNSSFASVAANAWVGTTITQSEELATLIRSSLEMGRSIVFAVAKEKEREWVS